MSGPGSLRTTGSNGPLLPWLGEVPANWALTRVKRAYDVQLGKMLQPSREKADDRLVPYLKALHVQWESLVFRELPEMWATPAETVKYSVKPGDLLVCEGGDVGRAAIIKEYVSAIIQNSLHRVRGRPNRSDPRFLLYLLRLVASAGWIEVLCNKATISHFTGDKFASLVIPLPPSTHQTTIADYLDRETAKIDTLVAKKERLIALLEENRAALIYRAVTRGLDPTVPMKHSGISWVGQMPAHWEAKCLGYLARSLQTGPFGSQLHCDEYVSDGIPVINPSNLRGGSVVPDQDCSVDKATWLRLRQHAVMEGDLVFARRGELGRCALVTRTEHGWLCGTGSLRMRPRTEIVQPRFVNWLLMTKGVADRLLMESVGSTMDNLNTDILSRLPLPVPPVPEQVAIVDYLDAASAKLDAVIAKTRQQIGKLQEYRTALISAAVTGRIDVRGTAA